MNSVLSGYCAGMGSNSGFVVEIVGKDGSIGIIFKETLIGLLDYGDVSRGS